MNKRVTDIMNDLSVCGWNVFTSSQAKREVAIFLDKNNYRKHNEIALEVIDEVIEKAKGIFCPDCEYDVADIRYNLDWLGAEIKNKYS